MEMAESTGSCGRSTQSKEIEEERKMAFKVFDSLRQHHPDEIAVVYSLELVEG